jgi:DNA-binding MarR family transcriptional regulator
MEQRLFEMIMQIRKNCLRTEEKIRKKLYLTPGEFNGLLSIEPGENISGTTFSQRMVLSPSRGSRVISKLSQNGYISLNIVPDNRRSVEASLTEKGIAMQKQLAESMSECEENITSQLDPLQLQEVRQALKILIEVM